jgi:hypothetical protein
LTPKEVEERADGFAFFMVFPSSGRAGCALVSLDYCSIAVAHTPLPLLPPE